MITGSFSSVARSTILVIFSPTTSPMLAIKKRPSQTPSAVSIPLIATFPVTTASSNPVVCFNASTFSGYPLYPIGFVFSIPLSHSSNVSSSAIDRIRSGAGMRKYP